PSGLIDSWVSGRLAARWARVGADETPIGNRTAPFLLEIIASWSDPKHNDRNIAWARQLFDGMHEFSSGKMNLNFSGAGEDNDRLVHSAFGKRRALRQPRTGEAHVRPDQYVSTESEHRDRGHVTHVFEPRCCDHERSHWVVWLKRNARWNNVRSDPRFEALLRNTELPRLTCTEDRRACW